MTRRTLFIADLHLQESDLKTTNQFIEFLNNEVTNTDVLYILGDFFEAWIGDDDHSPFITKITSALKQATTNGIIIYLMPGNRDFFIGDKFAQATGVKLLNDPTVIDLCGTKIMLSHGDMMCSDDWLHMHYRKVVSHKLLNKLFHLLPLLIRRQMAKAMRAISKNRNKNRNNKEFDLPFDTVFNTMQQNGVTLLIHGHLHRPITQELVIDEKLCKRICLNEWHSTKDTFVFNT